MHDYLSKEIFMLGKRGVTICAQQHILLTVHGPCARKLESRRR